MAAKPLLSTLALALSISSSASAAERAVEVEVTVPAKAEQVWEAWTTSAGIKTFFAPDAQVEARVGGPFQIYVNPLAPAGMRGADDMRFLALQPNRMLSFDWNAPPSLPEVRKQRTFVVVRLADAGDGKTRVSLHHTGWGDGGEWDKAYDYFAQAWPKVLGNLKKRFESGPIDWTDWMERMKKMTPAPAEKPAAK